MALLDIVQYPDQRLHTVAQPVQNIDQRIITLAQNMAQTMYQARGIGLAATQIDVHERVIVIDVSEERDQLRTFINPVIVHAQGETTYEEGCLSLPGIYDKVTRAEQVVVEYQDLDGHSHTLTADGLLAICLQHEIDHLNGIMFIERLSTLKQNRIKTKLKKRERAQS